ncbi:hypothetical protein ACOMHN_011089 [Nucella lapillus]
MEEEDLKAELTCPICMDLFREPRRLPCGHVYCRVCLQDMLTRKYLNTRASERILSCPECRQRYDLTFQSAGVDVFTRDFKLFRLVELFEKKFSRGREDAGGGGGGAGTGADDQTAVKTVDTSERESTPPPSTTTTTTTTTTTEPSPSHSTPASARSSISQQDQAESSVPPSSFPSPTVSVSDDSWVFVAPQSRQGGAARPVLPPAHAVARHQRDNDDEAWLMPAGGAATDPGSFPAERGQDVRGTASTDVSYRTLPGGDIEPVVTVTGRYDNVGPETFQQYVADDEPTVHLVRLPPKNHPPPPPPVASPSSDSSSESDTSDERGDEGSESGSDVGSHGRNRRSRLSRFFRSLVMSDTDSYDDDEDVYPRVSGGCGDRAPQQYRRRCGGGGGYRPRPDPVMAFPHLVREAPHSVREERGGEVPVAVASLPEVSYYKHGASAAAAGDLSSERGSRSLSTATHAGTERKQPCDSNHNSVGEARDRQRNAGAIRADIAAHAAERAGDSGGAVGGAGRALPSSGRPRAAIEMSDDSEEDYEPQTSMLRPKRKPRSRLKKFFTSLLSLSSSDEDEEGEEGVSVAPPPPSSSSTSTSTAERQ